MNPTKYILLVGNSAEELGIKVEKYLSEGWKLYGNPYLGSMVNYSHRHHQAVIQ